MGAFSLAIQVGTPDASRFEWFEMLVDTGSSYLVVPGSTLRGFGVTPTRKQRFKQADGRIVERDVGQTSVRINDQIMICTVTFGEGDDAQVLGAETLETFALGVDPVGRRLIPVDGLMMAQPAIDTCPCWGVPCLNPGSP
jgi:predicted aspartyl protease